MDQTIKILLFGMLSAISLLAQDDVSKTSVVSEVEISTPVETSLLSDVNRDGWLTEMKSKLPIASRKVGPFGLHQVRSEQPVLVQTKQAAPAAQDNAFKDAVEAIKINAVIAPVKFVIGAREFRVGDKFPITREGRTFKVKVISVKSSGITFQNLDTKKQVRKTFSKHPAGVTSGSGMSDIKGVQRAGGQAAKPLNLE